MDMGNVTSCRPSDGALSTFQGIYARCPGIVFLGAGVGLAGCLLIGSAAARPSRPASTKGEVFMFVLECENDRLLAVEEKREARNVWNVWNV